MAALFLQAHARARCERSSIDDVDLGEPGAGRHSFVDRLFSFLDHSLLELWLFLLLVLLAVVFAMIPSKPEGAVGERCFSFQSVVWALPCR